MGYEVVSFLEMTAPTQLVPGRPPPSKIELEVVEPDAVAELRATNVRVGRPHAWRGRTVWSDAEWAEELTRPGVRAWIARADGHVAGMIELEAEPGGDVGIVVFGLVPEFVGRGFGGALLEIAARFAWSLGDPTRRVWLQTSTRDHPHALPNYERRASACSVPNAGSTRRPPASRRAGPPRRRGA